MTALPKCPTCTKKDEAITDSLSLFDVNTQAALADRLWYALSIPCPHVAEGRVVEAAAKWEPGPAAKNTQGGGK